MTLRNSEFPASTYDGWVAQVEKVLKGKSIETLNIESLEGITLKPLYTNRPETGDKHVSRGWKSKPDWKISQHAQGKDPDELILFTKEELDRGSEVAALSEKAAGLFNEKKAAEFLTLENNLHIYIKHSNGEPWINALQNKDVRGVLGRDWGSPDNQTDKWFAEVMDIDSSHPELKSIILSSVSIHQKGANAIQELAYVIAQASNVIQVAEKNGWSAEKVISKMHVEFAVGSDFFLEISKLRAFRAVWRHFASYYQVDTHVSIGTETAQFTKLTQDEHTNMLRSGNEAFAAVLGGADYIYVRPYDCFKDQPSRQAVRAARNILLILKEEMFLQKLIDPAGGSYYIEHLTKDIAEKAWEKFCEIEEDGGITKARNVFMAEVHEIWNRRDQDVRTRKNSLVGMNKYAPAQKTTTEDIPETAGFSWDRLIQKVKNNEIAKVELLTVGELKDYKPRADFVKGVFAAAGVVLNSNVKDAEVVIVCGSDESYVQNLPSIIQMKKPEQKVITAGKFQSDDIDGCLYDGMDMVSFLEDVLFSQKGVSNHEA
ncbi:methylmalonyl-CoA mutase family protein [Jeotgalibacillus salarius]|nr:methylmalonyl-CoA mutase family protein [Jeotgalibacillus salarius]